jgi:hypothetical protein
METRKLTGMGSIFDGRGRVARGQWLHRELQLTAPGSGPGRQRRGVYHSYCFVQESGLQLAREARLASALLIDTVWIGHDRRLATSASFLYACADGLELPAIGYPQTAFEHGRALPPPRHDLRMPAVLGEQAELLAPPTLTLPFPAEPRDPQLVRRTLGADELHVHEWLRVAAPAADALVFLRPFDVPVLVGERFQPSLLADVTLLDELDRPALPTRVLLSGPNADVWRALRTYVHQLTQLVPHASVARRASLTIW